MSCKYLGLKMPGKAAAGARILRSVPSDGWMNKEIGLLRSPEGRMSESRKCRT
jgi:hypothetical protein